MSRLYTEVVKPREDSRLVELRQRRRTSSGEFHRGTARPRRQSILTSHRRFTYVRRRDIYPEIREPGRSYVGSICIKSVGGNLARRTVTTYPFEQHPTAKRGRNQTPLASPNGTSTVTSPPTNPLPRKNQYRPHAVHEPLGHTIFPQLGTERVVSLRSTDVADRVGLEDVSWDERAHDGVIFVVVFRWDVFNHRSLGHRHVGRTIRFI